MKRNFAVLLVLLLMAGLSSFAQKGYQVGDIAQDLSLKNVDGKMVSTQDYADAKGFIWVITCNTCPYSQMYEARIQALHDKYASLGYPVMAINPNDPVRKPGDSFEAMKANAKDKGFTFPYLMDESQEVALALGASRTPEVTVVEKTPKGLIVRYQGAIDDNARSANAAETHFVEDAVDALLAGKKVELTRTPSVGCTIKWRES